MEGSKAERKGGTLRIMLCLLPSSKATAISVANKDTREQTVGLLAELPITLAGEVIKPAVVVAEAVVEVVAEAVAMAIPSATSVASLAIYSLSADPSWLHSYKQEEPPELLPTVQMSQKKSV